MSKKNLNLKGLLRKQQGGEQSPKMKLSEQIQALLESGMQAGAIAQQLLASGVDELDIKEAFMDLGMAPSDVDYLLLSEEDIEQEMLEDFQVYQQEEPSGNYSDEDLNFNPFFGRSLNEAQKGGSLFPSTVNQYLNALNGYSKNPMSMYLPMDIGVRGDVLGAGFALGEAVTNMFGKQIDPNTGLKQGFFRDVKAKKARAKEAIPSYYNYKVTTDKADTNTYAADPRDLYETAKGRGKLRTQEQYESDLSKYSRVNADPKTGKYNALISSREIDSNSEIYGEAQRKGLEDFLGNSVSIDEFRGRFDPATKEMLLDTEKEGMGYLGISPSGEASTYRDIESNPYLYETMMGLNTLQSNMPKVDVSAKRYGGDLKRAQIGIETEPLSYDQWVQQTGRGMMGEEGVDMMEYQRYVDSFGQEPQMNEPQVDITNKFSGTLNRFMNSRPVQAFGKTSDFLVKGAGFMNEIAQNKKEREAQQRLYSMTQADNMFGYYEDPLNKKGTFDVNTGLAEQDNYVPYLRQFGGEDGSRMPSIPNLNEEIELDPDTVAQLIAAGANIEIL